MLSNAFESMILLIFEGFGARSEREFVSIFLDVVSRAFTLENTTVEKDSSYY